MTELRELMHLAIDHHHADMTGLAARARRRGTDLHRRERLTTAVASLAVLGVFVVGTAGGRAFFDHRRASDGSASIGTSATAPTAAAVLAPLRRGAGSSHRDGELRVHRTPLTRAIGQSTAQAVASVGGVSTSAVQSYLAEATPTTPANIEVSLRLTSPAGASVGRVSASFWAEATYGGSAAQTQTRAWLRTCGTFADCRTFTLSDGSLVRAAGTHQQLSGQTYRTNVVERDVDGVVQVVVAYAPRGVDGTVTAPDPPLTIDQLIQVASLLDARP